VTSAGEPRPDSTIDLRVKLPAVGAEGVIEVGALLRTEDAGLPRADDDVIEATPGKSSKSLVGTWPPAARTPCAGAPLDDEVCIPGGAFWMGEASPTQSATEQQQLAQRLVVLSPYYLMRTEVTAGALRGSGLPVEPWSGQSDGTDYHDWCTLD